MTATTHIALSCLLTVGALKCEMPSAARLLIVSAGSFLSHLLIDAVPHGYITMPSTLFRKVLPTVLELVPGPLILAAAIHVFGHPLLFCLAAVFGIIPDLVLLLLSMNRKCVEAIPALRCVHWLHRKVHWFEHEHPDGSVTFLFPNRPLLVCEACGAAGLVIALFAQRVV